MCSFKIFSIFDSPIEDLIQPQDWVNPSRKLLPSTSHSFPQSQTQCQIIVLLFLLSIGYNAINLPNLLFVISIPCVSLTKHPQLFVWPDFKRCVGTFFLFPQSQIHSQTILLLILSFVGFITVNLPNFCPTK